MKRLIFIMLTAVIGVSPGLAEEDLQVASVQYWIDNDHASATVSSTLEFDVACSDLPTGYHTLHYRVLDSQGHYSALQEHGFLTPMQLPSPILPMNSFSQPQHSL